MSLQYVIDGYNIINHPRFTRRITTPDIKDCRLALIQFIISDKIFRNPRNSVTVIFDGYCHDQRQYGDYGVKVIFSGDISADDKIRQVIESSANRKNMVAVSDDKEIRLFARAFKVKAMAVDEFIPEPVKANADDSVAKTDLTYTQIEKINKELRKLWLE